MTKKKGPGPRPGERKDGQAAPPDDGHVGSHTRPDDVLEPRDEEDRSPPLNRDPQPPSHKRRKEDDPPLGGNE